MGNRLILLWPCKLGRPHWNSQNANTASVTILTVFRRRSSDYRVAKLPPLRSSPCRQHVALGNLKIDQVTTQAYQQASQRFLDQAKQELATGDLLQASEKGWGAAAQMIKAIAESLDDVQALLDRLETLLKQV